MCFLTRFLHTCSVFEIHIVQFSKTKLPRCPYWTAFLLYYPVSALSSVFRNFFQKNCRLAAASFPKKPPFQGSSAIIPKPIRFCQGGFAFFCIFSAPKNRPGKSLHLFICVTRKEAQNIFCGASCFSEIYLL